MTTKEKNIRCLQNCKTFINPIFKWINQKINNYICLHSYLAIWLTLPPEVAFCSLTMLLNL